MEKHVEAKLVKLTERRGGWCRKVKAEAFTGWPDRELFLPGGEYHIVETKYDDKGELSPRQKYVIKQLAKRGHTVHVVTNEQELEYFFNNIVRAPVI